MQPAYRDRGVQVIGFVCYSSDEFAREFIQRHGLSYPVALDQEGTFESRFASWIPITALIDDQGRFRWAASGFFPQLILPALDAVLAGREPAYPEIPPPRPEDLRVMEVEASLEGDLLISAILDRQDYRIADLRLESASGRVTHCRNDLPIREQWEQDTCTCTWWLAPVDRNRHPDPRARLVFVPHYQEAPQWGTHLPRLPDVVMEVRLPAPEQGPAVELIAARLGELSCCGEASTPAHRLFASHVRFHRERARWLYWWEKGERLKMAEAGERMVSEPFASEVWTDSVSPWHVKVGDAFAAAGEGKRARRHYQKALETAGTEEERQSAREYLAALETQSRRQWQAAALQRTQPPQD